MQKLKNWSEGLDVIVESMIAVHDIFVEWIRPLAASWLEEILVILVHEVDGYYCQGPTEQQRL